MATVTRLVLLLLTFAAGPFRTNVPAQAVAVLPGFSVTYPAGLIGGSSATGIPHAFVNIPPAKEYFLDYEVQFDSAWDWVKGGKLPGLVGGTHTSGCADIVPDGWSARFMWRANGGAELYYYHQDRVSGCGDEFAFSNSRTFKKGVWNRITEHVVINTPGQADGLAEAWLNGEKVVSLAKVRWRGQVGANIALVDQVSLQTFYGGSTNDWAPPVDTKSKFSPLVVRDDLPDLSRPFDPAPKVVSRISTAPGARLQGIAASRQGYAITYLGEGAVPYLPGSGGRADLFDTAGNRLAGLVWEQGRWQWEGMEPEKIGLSPGMYLIRYDSGGLPFPEAK